MKLIFNLLFIIISVNNLKAQAPNIQWQKTFGGSLNDRGNYISKTNDGGYIIAAKSKSSDGDVSINKGGDDVWLIKLDSLGTIIWEKSLGGYSGEDPNTIYQTVDGGYIFYATTLSNDMDVVGLHMDSIFPSPDYDGWLVKTDNVGNIQWQKCLGGTDSDFGIEMSLSSDNNFILAEEIYSNDGDVTGWHGEDDYWFLKVDTSGNILWKRAYGNSDFDTPGTCTETTDGGYLIGGASSFNFGGFHGNPVFSQDIGLVKVDSAGNKIWSQCYGGSNGEYPYSIIPGSNGGFYMISECTSDDGDATINYGGSDVWIVNADSTGSIIWQRSYGGSYDDIPSQVIKTTDGGLVIVSTTSSHDIWVSNHHGQYDMWIFKLDSMGTLEWEKTLGGSLDDLAFSVVETDDDGLLICGSTTSTDDDVTFNHGEEDVWLVKLAPLGLSIAENENAIMDLQIFQDEDLVTIKFYSRQQEFVDLNLIDMLGKKNIITNIYVDKGYNNYQFNSSGFSSGLYLISLKSKNGILNKKIVLK
jgi:hypothetical protein